MITLYVLATTLATTPAHAVNAPAAAPAPPPAAAAAQQGPERKQAKPQEARGGQGRQGRAQAPRAGKGGGPQKQDDAKGRTRARPEQREQRAAEPRRKEPGAGPEAGRGEPRGQGQPARAAREGHAENRSVDAPRERPAKLTRRHARAGAAQLRGRVEALPAELRRLARRGRPHERMVVGAVTYATLSGLAADRLDVRAERDRIRVLNRDDELLLDLDERSARDLGAWEIRRLGDQRPRGNAPAFCRSGEGHPVWGREWCLDKGFGLGGSDDRLWGRGSVDDVVFGRVPDRERLDRPTLIDVLGDVVFGRLALHALSLGYDQPLRGVWVAEPQAPQLLRVYAGDHAVAELVDLDRDSRAEVLYVALPL